MTKAWPSSVVTWTCRCPSCLERGLDSVKTCIDRGSQQACNVLREWDGRTVTSRRPSVSWERTEKGKGISGVLNVLTKEVQLLSIVKARSVGIKQLKIKIQWKVNLQIYTESKFGSHFRLYSRVDSVAHKKNLILKSYQSADLIDLLPYHQCDSRAPSKAEHLKCLLNLQIQHIHARFAVFLTGNPQPSFWLL